MEVNQTLTTFSFIRHEVKTTKVLNEQSIALVNKKIDAQTLDVADVKQAFQDTMDLVQVRRYVHENINASNNNNFIYNMKFTSPKSRS